jgi:hypothetical protein
VWLAGSRRGRALLHIRLVCVGVCATGRAVQDGGGSVGLVRTCWLFVALLLQLQLLLVGVVVGCNSYVSSNRVCGVGSCGWCLKGFWVAPVVLRNQVVWPTSGPRLHDEACTDTESGQWLPLACLASSHLSWVGGASISLARQSPCPCSHLSLGPAVPLPECRAHRRV